jgi:hypothetical protein
LAFVKNAVEGGQGHVFLLAGCAEGEWRVGGFDPRRRVRGRRPESPDYERDALGGGGVRTDGQLLGEALAAQIAEAPSFQLAFGQFRNHVVGFGFLVARGSVELCAGGEEMSDEVAGSSPSLLRRSPGVGAT